MERGVRLSQIKHAAGTIGLISNCILAKNLLLNRSATLRPLLAPQHPSITLLACKITGEIASARE